MTEWVGLVAALATAVAFSFTATFFTIAGRELGSPLVNRTRLLIAVACIPILHWALLGRPLPTDAEPYRWGWLALSGVIGLALGDAFLFQAFVTVGPRLSMLVMALAPVIAAAIAWLFLGETLSGLEVLGIALALSGVAAVITEPSRATGFAVVGDYRLGLLYALGGAMGQAIGLVTSRLGLEGDFPTLSANLIRVLAAAVAIWAVTLLRGGGRSSFRALRRSPRALAPLTLGTLLGPVLGVWLSLVAVQRAPIGIASTLMSLTPIFLIPVARVVFGDEITRRAVAGTALAFAGTAILFVS
jgi:drug/metabolite transporter (DMT)-like permease